MGQRPIDAGDGLLGVHGWYRWSCKQYYKKSMVSVVPKGGVTFTLCINKYGHEFFNSSDINQLLQSKNVVVGEKYMAKSFQMAMVLPRYIYFWQAIKMILLIRNFNEKEILFIYLLLQKRINSLEKINEII